VVGVIIIFLVVGIAKSQKHYMENSVFVDINGVEYNIKLVKK